MKIWQSWWISLWEDRTSTSFSVLTDSLPDSHYIYLSISRESRGDTLPRSRPAAYNLSPPNITHSLRAARAISIKIDPTEKKLRLQTPNSSRLCLSHSFSWVAKIQLWHKHWQNTQCFFFSTFTAFDFLRYRTCINYELTLLI